jgi:dihydrofolate reductase
METIGLGCDADVHEHRLRVESAPSSWRSVIRSVSGAARLELEVGRGSCAGLFGRSNERVAEAHDFAAAWRSRPKWVVSRSLKSVGPNATLVEDDIEAVIRGLKAQLVGEIEVAGPDLAGSLTTLGLIDEYRLYLRPIVLGRGKPFFAGPRPPLRLVASDLVGEMIKLTYVPA